MNTTEASLSQINRYLVENECRQLIVAAAFLIDGGKYADLNTIFAPAAQLMRPNGSALEGCDAIIASYASRPVDRLTRHLILGTWFTSIAEQAATSTTQVLLWTASTADNPGSFGRPTTGPQIVGRIEDEFCLTSNGWKISKRSAYFELNSGNA
ncbi:hypothetical protein OKW43_000080 [Paraburkholderia sp. WC7.3g]|uniref:nuclear transport factor 2 family protein n=1 Tax=Paraburkholderia sp. WC7.3g TaxID=2991070 RepID=UPI003D1F1A85